MWLFTEILTCVLVVIVTNVLLGIIYGTVSESLLKVFAPFQMVVSNVKRKGFLRGIIFCIIVIASTTIKIFFNLNNVTFGIIIGFFVSIEDFVFRAEVSTEGKEHSIL